jgi:Rod binding domain-containing protein
MFDSIFQNDIASMISKNHSLGVADILYKKITGEKMDEIPRASGTLKLDNISKPENLDVEKILSIVPGEKAISRLNKYKTIIDNASVNYGVDRNLIKSVILAESSAKENALSSAKAKGLMQLIDSTAIEVGVNNVWDPSQNILGGTKYLAGLLRKYNGDINLALASYNAGSLNVDKYGGIPPFEETQNYVKRVIGYLNHLNGEENGNERSI